jgi:hypothetical protein
VTTGFVPDADEVNKGGLVAVLEDDADHLLKQANGDWNQPHTRFVVSEISGIPEGGVLTLNFPSHLVVKEVLPNGTEQLVISGVTEIDQGSDSLFIAYGTTKSAAELDTEVTLVLNGGGFVDLELDKVRVTVVDAFYEINLTTFIPYDAFYAPGQTFTQTVTGGDNRDFDRMSPDFRTRHVIMVSPFIEFDVDGVFGEEKGDGWSREYDASTSLLNYDPNQTDPDLLQLKTIAKEEAEIEANRGAPYKKDWAQGDGSSLIQTIERQNSRTLHLFFNGDESNPLWDLWIVNLSPGITYEFEMILDAMDVLQPILNFEVAHDGFPAYELYIDMTTAYLYDPRDHGEDVYDLYPSMDVYQPFTQINAGC